MNHIIRLYIILGLILGSFSLGAQSVDSPDLLCIRNDSLIWNNVPNNCGPFVSIRIFRATDLSGPYTEIATLTDASETTFLDPNPAGQLRFYYISYNYDCPGFSFLNSDTLNNLIPLPPPAVWASVEDSTVVVNWTASSSPQTAGYRIFRREPQGLILIATVSDPSQLFYVDNNFTTQPVSEAYAVAAIDACGSQSLLSSQATSQEATSSVLSLSGGNGCTFIITANTDAPDVSSIPLPIIGWEMFVSTNGGPFGSVGNFGAGNTFSYDQANDGENICIYLVGQIQGQPNRPLRTPIQCVDVSIVQPVRPFRLLGGGFDAAGNFCFDFDWDSQAAVDLLQANLNDAGSQTSALPIDFTSLAGPITSNCSPTNAYPDPPFSLSLRAEDVCDNIIITNRLDPTFLSGLITNGSNQLTWTPFASELDIRVNYQLERTGLDGNSTIIYDGADLSFTDPVQATDANLALSCYRILTTVTYASDGYTATYASQTVCLEQTPMIYLPNAFSPEATMVLNREFCPGFARRPTGIYQLDIWDRWGGHVFTSSDPDICWNGEYRGRIAESGTYLYVLKLAIGNQTVERSGTVNLLR